MKNESTEKIFRESRLSFKGANGKPISMQTAADELFIDYKTVERYELGEQIPSPEMICRMSRLYNDPALRRVYCTEICDIGKIDHVYSKPHGLFASGFKLISASEKLEEIKSSLFNILSDGVVDADEIKILSEVIPEQIKSVKKVLNEIEIEIEKRNFT